MQDSDSIGPELRNKQRFGQLRSAFSLFVQISDIASLPDNWHTIQSGCQGLKYTGEVYRSLRLFTVNHEPKDNCTEVNSQDYQRHVVLVFRIGMFESTAPMRKIQRRTGTGAKDVTSQLDGVPQASSDSILGGEQDRHPVDIATPAVLTACCRMANSASRSEFTVISD